jgi:hypothetical protein
VQALEDNNNFMVKGDIWQKIGYMYNVVSPVLMIAANKVSCGPRLSRRHRDKMGLNVQAHGGLKDIR